MKDPKEIIVRVAKEISDTQIKATIKIVEEFYKKNGQEVNPELIKTIKQSSLEPFIDDLYITVLGLN